jgi:hypothetical protein
MSDSVFPALPGLTWNVKRVPLYATSVQRSKSLREVRISYAAAPVYRLEFSYDFLRSGATRGSKLRAELDTLEDFFHQHAGAGETFLYRDPYDHLLRGELLGVGDGSTRSFTLGRTRGTRTETIRWLDAGTQPLVIGPLMWSEDNAPMWSSDSAPMWSGGYETAAATVSGGTVTLPSAPAAGQEVRATVGFYYRARFESDEQEFTNFLQGLWSASVKLRAALGDQL